MKPNFERFPLDVFNESSSISVLEKIKAKTTLSQIAQPSISQEILSLSIKKAADLRFAAILNSVSDSVILRNAQNRLEDFMREQVVRIKYNPLTFLKEAQLNLIATACITQYMAEVESVSLNSQVKNISKAFISSIKNLSLTSGVAEFTSSIFEKMNQYDDICKIYFTAFLLNVSKENPQLEEYAKTIIEEILCDETEESLLLFKKCPILFSDVEYKTVDENLSYRLNVLEEEAKRYSDLEVFVKWRRNHNKELDKTSKADIK